MAQLTIRLDDDLAREVKAHATGLGHSVNSWVVAVLGAAVNPDLEDSESARTLARLERAGLLAKREGRARGTPPDPGRVERARKAAGTGTPPLAPRLGRARLSVFCDSSALVKLYADEAGADEVRRLTNLVVSGLARVEVPAALWRKHRLGELSAADTALLVEEFEWDWFGEAPSEVDFAVLAVTSEILDEAARSVARHALRAFDAVQLASAVIARAADASLTEFACFDETLADAARAESFAVLP